MKSMFWSLTPQIIINLGQIASIERGVGVAGSDRITLSSGKYYDIHVDISTMILTHLRVCTLQGD
jgi:hypothetical protein